MSQKNTTNKTSSNENNLSAVFGKKNYIILAAGVLLMVVGYLLMIGGRAADPAIFNPAEIYSSTRITVAPILILAGIVVNIYAILAKNK